MSKKIISKLALDSAEVVSFNSEISREYLTEKGVDFNKFHLKGLKEIQSLKKKEFPKQLSKSQFFFRRSVLAAKIAHECHAEWTFGSVKFQKLVYLCEHVSKMILGANYAKHAAGPMDSKFIHSIKATFEKQDWFKVEKVKSGKYEKVQFTPLDKVESYKSYYQNYYSEELEDIQYIIDTFRKSKTDFVELVATIFHCWDEAKEKDYLITDALIIDKVYNFHKSKKKFTEDDITKTKQWMIDNSISPA